MFPSIVKNFNTFVNGRGFAGLVDEAELPELNLKMEEHRAGGMDGTSEVEMGQEKMAAKLTGCEYNADLFKLWGLADGNSARIVLRGAAVRDSDGAVTQVLVELGGKIHGLKAGSMKAGEKTKCEFNIAVNYFRFNQAGEDLIEIDVLNMVRIVGGVDQLAAQRDALGI